METNKIAGIGLNCIVLLFLIGFVIIERKLRKGRESISLEKTEADRNSTNLVGLSFVVGFPVVAYLYRINFEEKMLENQFGNEYFEYEKATKRLIPFIY